MSSCTPASVKCVLSNKRCCVTIHVMKSGGTLSCRRSTSMEGTTTQDCRDVFVCVVRTDTVLHVTAKRNCVSHDTDPMLIKHTESAKFATMRVRALAMG